MNSNEAMHALMSGKKVRNTEWVKDAYIYYDKKSLTIKDNNNKSQTSILFDDYFSMNQWEMYEEDERRSTMNFEEARKALLEGKKVRCVDWAPEDYIYFDEKNMVVRDNNDDIQTYGIYNFFKDREWELYEEPKKVIKVFISQPMRGKIKCEITEERNKVKKAIEKKYGKKHRIEYLNENLWERPKDWTRIQHLGCSIMNMHDADIVIFAPNWLNAPGCCVEHEAAYYYNKKMVSCIIGADGEYCLF